MSLALRIVKTNRRVTRLVLWLGQEQIADCQKPMLSRQTTIGEFEVSNLKS